MASPNVIWQLVKKNNAFIAPHKNGGKHDHKITFSKEKGNLKSKNSFKFSGLANHKAIDLVAAEGGGVVVSVKSSKNADAVRPASTWKSAKLSRDFRRVARSLKQAARGRPDLQDTLLARYTLLNGVKAGRVQKKRRGRKSA